MPGGGKGKHPYERLHIAVPIGLFREAEAVVQSEGKWLSLADFARDAIKEKVDRWKASGHRLPEGPGPGDLVERVRAREPAAPKSRRPSP